MCVEAGEWESEETHINGSHCVRSFAFARLGMREKIIRTMDALIAINRMRARTSFSPFTDGEHALSVVQKCSFRRDSLQKWRWICTYISLLERECYEFLHTKMNGGGGARLSLHNDGVPKLLYCSPCVSLSPALKSSKLRRSQGVCACVSTRSLDEASLLKKIAPAT